MLTLDMKTHLKQLEESLWRDETRFDTLYMEKVLHPDFFEFGRSGRVYERSKTIYVPRSHIDAILPLENLEYHEVSDDTVLLTYRSQVKYETLEIWNRSSLWVKCEDIWQLYFHQGTPTWI